MAGGSGAQVTGYWYSVGMHMVCCHSPVTELKQIIVGDKIAWQGSVSSNQTIHINKPDLQGGEEREGGIVGDVDILFGGPSQPCNDYLVDVIGHGPTSVPKAPNLADGMTIDSDGRVHLPDGTLVAGYQFPPPTNTAGLSGYIPAFRRVFSVVLRRVDVCANSAYIKQWAFRLKRCPNDVGVDIAEINGDANPAAIIQECLTNTKWGNGHPLGNIDTDSFRAAGLWLKDEGFGMSLIWSDQDKIEDFISHILKTINGYRWTDPTTGRIGIRLARADYDINTLPEFGPDNIVELSQFNRPDLSDIINQVTITFNERTKDQKRSITMHNGAAIDLTGRISATTIDFPGIPNMTIAQRVCQRELETLSRGLANVQFTCNRAAFALRTGDVFKFTWPEYGIVEMVLRAQEVNYGLLTDGRMTVTAIEDLFGMPETTYLGGGGSEWVDPNTPLEAIGNGLVFELPYYVVRTRIAGEDDAYMSGLPDGYAFVGATAAKPQANAVGYNYWNDGSGSLKQVQGAAYTPEGRLEEDINDTATSFDVTWGDLANLTINTYAILGSDEWVKVTGINNTTVTVIRGIFDTVPKAHAEGERLYVLGGNNFGADKTVYLSGQTINNKLQPKTPSEVQPLADVANRAITLKGRANRPLAPGNIKIMGEYRPPIIMGDINTYTPAIEWARRNRITIGMDDVSQTDPDMTPEVGQTTTVKIYQQATDADAYVLVETASGLTGTTYNPIAALNGARLRIEINSQRSGLDSEQTQVLYVDRAGYGLNYGAYYGSRP